MFAIGLPPIISITSSQLNTHSSFHESLLSTSPLAKIYSSLPSNQYNYENISKRLPTIMVLPCYFFKCLFSPLNQKDINHEHYLKRFACIDINDQILLNPHGYLVNAYILCKCLHFPLSPEWFPIIKLSTNYHLWTATMIRMAKCGHMLRYW